MLDLDLNLEHEEVKVKVLGIGSRGNYFINKMINEGMIKAEFISVASDKNVLETSNSILKLELDKFNEEAEEKIKELLTGTDMTFVVVSNDNERDILTAAFIAELSKKLKIFTLGIIEGVEISLNFENCINKFKDSADCLIVTPSKEKLYFIGGNIGKTSSLGADEVIKVLVKIINTEGTVTLDFADMMSAMKGITYIGEVITNELDNMIKDTKQAINGLMFEMPLKNAKTVVINVYTKNNLGIEQFEDTFAYMQDLVNHDTEIIFAIDIVPNLEEEVSMTFIMSGFKN